MAGNTFIGPQPSGQVWNADGTCVYFMWNPNQELIETYYKYTLKTKKIEKIELNSSVPQPLNGLISSSSPTSGYFKQGHTIYHVENGSTKAIYRNRSNYSVVRIFDGKLLIRQEENLFIYAPKTTDFLQISNFKQGQSPVNSEKTYLETQQTELFETIRIQEQRKKAQTDYTAAITPDQLQEFYLGDSYLGDVNLSNDLRYLVFTTGNFSVDRSTEMMRFITTDGYTKSENARAKVGHETSQSKLYFWNLEKDSILKIDCSKLTDINRLPDYYAEYPDRPAVKYKKSLIFHLHEINEDENKTLVEIKSTDNKDRWIGYVDLENGQFVEINHQHDEKWIGGPGITGWNSVAGTVGWINAETIYYQDEKTGYSHLYAYSINSGKTKALTAGNFEIYEAQLAKDKKSFYITANKNHPGNREFYQLILNDLQLIPILTADGNYEVQLSPDEKKLLIRYSYKNKPWELYVAPNEKQTKMEAITQSERPDFNSYAWRSPEIISYQATDGQAVNARIYKPEESTKNGAAILFVHGAGYLQNAHNWWSSYYREYMFNNLLCDLGYTVLDVDYRASEGYGRDFRTAIYRHMGGKDLSDFVDARSYLIHQHDIDSNRVGIYGGSYGGFITLMALLTEPGKFKCGAAIRSVTDWAHYNHAYTANILNTPETDPIAYSRSSPIYFAENLSDQLLMLHGMVDDNVQYQDVVRLSQRFIELGKKNWDLVGYPVEPHGFIETSSWVDEYGRILTLFNAELLTDKK